MITFNKIFCKGKIKVKYQEYIAREINDTGDGKNIFLAILAVSLICLAATIYVFWNIGYVPLLKIFDPGFDKATARIEISRGFQGNIYIRNLICLTITPLLSYISYIYYRVTRKRKWLYLLGIQIVLCILV